MNVDKTIKKLFRNLRTRNGPDEAWTNKHIPHSRRMIKFNKNRKYKMIRNNNSIQISDSSRI